MTMTKPLFVLTSITSLLHFLPFVIHTSLFTVVVCLHFSPPLLLLLLSYSAPFSILPLFSCFLPFYSSPRISPLLPFTIVILSSSLSSPFVLLRSSHLFLSSSSLCVHYYAPNPALPLPVLSALYISSLFPTLQCFTLK